MAKKIKSISVFALALTACICMAVSLSVSGNAKKASAADVTLNETTFESGDFLVSIQVGLVPAEINGTEDDSYGVRFNIRLTKEKFEALLDGEGNITEGVKTGVLISSAAKAEEIGGLDLGHAYVEDKLVAGVKDKELNAKWHADTYNDTDYYVARVTIYAVPQSGLDTQLKVVPYITYGGYTTIRTNTATASMRGVVIEEGSGDAYDALREEVLAYTLSYYDGEDQYGESVTAYYGEEIEDMPTLDAKANRINDGWCSVECEELDDTPTVTVLSSGGSEQSLYAHWRLPKNSAVTESSGTYTISGNNITAVLGETDLDYAQYDMNATYYKGSTGGGQFFGISFRMNKYVDNGLGGQFLNAHLRSSSNNTEGGALRLHKYDTVGSLGTASLGQTLRGSLPSAWQSKYAAADAGEYVTVKMTIRDYGDYFKVYIDDDLAVTYTGDQSAFTGKGYGVWAQLANVSFTFTCSEIPHYTVTFMNGEAEYATKTYVDDALSLELPAANPSREGKFFTGWYYDEDCTQLVDASAPVITGDTVIYAGFSDVVYTVTFMDNGEEYATVDYAAGTATLDLPDDPANLANSIFDGWYYDSACTLPVDASAPEITKDTTIYAYRRLPSNSGFTYNEVNDTYSATQGVASPMFGLFGINEYTYTEYNYNLTYVIGGTGGSKFAGITIRMKKYYDGQSSTEGLQYISIMVKTGGGDTTNGAIRIFSANRNTGETVTTVNTDYRKSLPSAWLEKYGAKAKGDTMNVLLTVRDYGSYLKIYIDGELAITYDNAMLAGYNGTGYGTYIQGSTVSAFKITTTELSAE